MTLETVIDDKHELLMKKTNVLGLEIKRTVQNAKENLWKQ